MFHKRLMKEFNCNTKYTIGIVAAQWISLVANLALVAVIAGIVNLVWQQATAASDFLLLSGVLLLTLTARGLAFVWSDRMAFKASANVKSRLRELIYSKLMRLSATYRQTTSTAEAVQLSTEGVEQLEIYFSQYVPQFFYSLLAPLTLFAVVGSMSSKVAIVLLICVPLIPLSIVAVQKLAGRILSKYWGSYTKMGDSFLESLQGLTTLKIYQAEERYAKKMDEGAENFRKITMKVLIMQLNSISVMDLVAYLGAAIGIILTILEYKNGNIGLFQSFFIIIVSAEFFLPLRRLGSFFHIAMNGKAAADKIFRLVDAPEAEEGNISFLNEETIQFEQVTFGYQREENRENSGREKQVISELSFDIQKRNFTALVGQSGSGKSTIASLLMGEHRNYEGIIRIGDAPIEEIHEAALHQRITRIRHNSYIFQGTVEENLRMGKEAATEKEMKKVLQWVDLWETVMRKGGLTMELTEKADNLSGGQKQRLALARAILHDSNIYIFDEATSNIDAESENKIMEVIYELAKTKTILLITHRLSCVTRADQILVLQNGRIAEKGKHGDLMSKKGYYSRLYAAQQELENYVKEVS